MHCHQVIPGTVNSGLYKFSVGSVHDDHFIAYASGCNIVILDSNFDRIQTIPGIHYGSVDISCITCSRESGLIAASVGSCIRIFHPCRSFIRIGALNQSLNYEWDLLHTINTKADIEMFAWSQNVHFVLISTRLPSLEVWTDLEEYLHFRKSENEEPAKFSIGGDEGDGPDIKDDKWFQVWKENLLNCVILGEYSPNGSHFATVAAEQSLVRIWHREGSLDKVEFRCQHLLHPCTVSFLSWRNNSRFLYGTDAMSDCLLTVGDDNISRIWTNKQVVDRSFRTGTWMDDNDDKMSGSSLSRQSSFGITGHDTYKHSLRLTKAIKIRQERIKGREDVKSKQENAHHVNLKKHSSLYSHHAGSSSLLSKANRWIASHKHLGLQKSHSHSSFNHHHHHHHHNHHHQEKSVDDSTKLSVLAIPSHDSAQKSLPSRGSRVFLSKTEIHSFFSQSGSDLESMDKGADGDVKILHRCWSLAASIDPTTDFSTTTHRVRNSGMELHCSHWLDNKEFYFTLMTEYLLLKMFRSHSSLAVRDASLDPVESDSPSSGAMSGTVYEENRHSADGRKILKSLVGLNKLYRTMSENELMRTIRSKQDLDGEESRLHQARFEQMINQMRLFPDLLFCVNPDGSMSFWMVENLDNQFVDKCHVSLITKLNKTMDVVDARTMGRSMRLFYDIDFVIPDVSLSSLHSRLRAFHQAELYIPNGLRMISKHKNGLMNLWDIQFSDKKSCLLVSAVVHLKRLCGHSRELTEVRSHPFLPLVLTTSNSSDERGLIVWAVKSCRSLMSSMGGVDAVDKIYSSRTTGFSLVAWFDAIRPKIMPETCSNGLFIAFDGDHIGVYHVNCGSDFSNDESVQGEDKREWRIPGNSLIYKLADIAESSQCWHEAALAFLLPAISVADHEELRGPLGKSLSQYYLIIIEERQDLKIIGHAWQVNIDEYTNPLKAVTDLNISSKKLSSFEFSSTETYGGLVCATLMAHFLNSAFMAPISRTPAHVATLHSNGFVNLWTCFHDEVSGSLHWKSWKDGDSEPILVVPGIPLSIKCAYCCRLAVAYTAPESNDFGDDFLVDEKQVLTCLKVEIMEAESTAGESWRLEDTITVSSSTPIPGVNENGSVVLPGEVHTSRIPPRRRRRNMFKRNRTYSTPSYNGGTKSLRTHDSFQAVSMTSHRPRTASQYTGKSTQQFVMPNKLVYMDWGTSGEGTHLLTLAIGDELLFFCRQGYHRNWKEIHRTHLNAHTGLYPSPVQLKWIRAGLLMVGLHTEIQIFSPWTINELSAQKVQETRRNLMRRGDIAVLRRQEFMNAASGKRLMAEKTPHLTKLPLANWNEFETSTIWSHLRNASKFHPHYEPKTLIGLILAGKKDWALKILNGLHASLLRQGEWRRVTPVALHDLLRCDESRQLDGGQMESDVDWLSMPVSLSSTSATELDSSEQIKPKKKNNIKCDLQAIANLLDTSVANPQLLSISSRSLSGLKAVIQSLISIDELSNYSDEKGVIDQIGETCLFLRNCRPSDEEKTVDIGWAHFSESQRALIDVLTVKSCKESFTWDAIKAFRFSLWVSDNAQLREIVEKVAHCSYIATDDPLDAALFYIALGKLNLLSNLFKIKGNEKLHDFFTHTISEENGPTVAAKNAFVLLRNHKYMQAVAFFLLANKLDYAIETCVNRLNDKDLALLIIRIGYPNELSRFLTTHYINDDGTTWKERCIAYSLLNQRSTALHSLLQCAKDVCEESSIALYRALSPRSCQRTVDLDLLPLLAYKQLADGRPLLALCSMMCFEDTSNMFARALRFKASIQILAAEMKSLSANMEVADTPVRNYFLMWLRQAVKSLNLVCDYDGSVPDENLYNRDIDHHDTSWIRNNELLLRILLSYCQIHSGEISTSYRRGVDAVKLELLCLFCELWSSQAFLDLSNFLPPFLRLPLLSVSGKPEATAKPYGQSFDGHILLNVTAIREMVDRSRSILIIVTQIKTLPSLNSSLAYRMTSLVNEAYVLSNEVYQLLLYEQKEFEYDAAADFMVNEEVVENTKAGRMRRFSFTLPENEHAVVIQEKHVQIAASQWPGVDCILNGVGMLRESDFNAPSRCLLLQSFSSCFLALLTTALMIVDPRALLRLVSVKWDSKLWSHVFGYGEITTTAKHWPVSDSLYVKGKFHPPTKRIFDVLFKDNQSSTLGNAENAREDVEVCCMEHADPRSYSWCLMRLAILHLTKYNIAHLLSMLDVDGADIVMYAPALNDVLNVLNQWTRDAETVLDLNEFLKPANFATFQIDSTAASFNERHKDMFCPENSPFCFHGSGKDCSELWFSLMRQQCLHDMFVQRIYNSDKSQIFNVRTNISHESTPEEFHDQPQIVYEDSKCISCFTSSKVVSNILALSTTEEIVEMNVSYVIKHTRNQFETIREEGCDIWSLGRGNTVNRNLELADFLLLMKSSSQFPVATDSLRFKLSETNSRSSGMQRNFKDVRTMASHPSKPVYACGLKDGRVFTMLWGRNRVGNEIQLNELIGGGNVQSSIVRVGFSDDGYRLASADSEGELRVFQLTGEKASLYMSMLCHSKRNNDFLFMNTSSLILTAGLSADCRNVALWDTLLPKRSSCVAAFKCHEGGCISLVKHPDQNNIILTSGRRGDVVVFDIRNRKKMLAFEAHRSAVKGLCLDPSGRVLVTGSSEGHIKVWRWEESLVLHTYHSCHSKSSLIKGARTGVTQIELFGTQNMFSSGYDGTLQHHLLPPL